MPPASAPQPTNGWTAAPRPIVTLRYLKVTHDGCPEATEQFPGVHLGGGYCGPDHTRNGMGPLGIRPSVKRGVDVGGRGLREPPEPRRQWPSLGLIAQVTTAPPPAPRHNGDRWGHTSGYPEV